LLAYFILNNPVQTDAESCKKIDKVYTDFPRDYHYDPHDTLSGSEASGHTDLAYKTYHQASFSGVQIDDLCKKNGTEILQQDQHG